MKDIEQIVGVPIIRAYGIPLWDTAYDTTRNGKLSIELDEAVRIKMKTHGTKKLSASVPRFVAEVIRYDNTLEDLPTRQTHTPTGRHIKMSDEID